MRSYTIFSEFEDEDDEGGYDVADHSDRDDDESMARLNESTNTPVLRTL